MMTIEIYDENRAKAIALYAWPAVPRVGDHMSIDGDVFVVAAVEWGEGKVSGLVVRVIVRLA